ncbi:MAG: UbiA family prenyltransferase [Methanobacterium formicicum]|jgi:geranylgeranylglycerol-phosphate geranylgeranyltransferase|uniref:Digeranylgeranylglyceryl phosphate synthase n=1 Tax=Methanobacterium formicicum TaxID=2162 RepID=A0A089ZH25_METFO|nr:MULTISPECIES: UbiA family prenyltransferase [Methanobacterium]AIS31558.1 digeranylgeranylglyceryl phosphate synthase [Methanobacterium formicicum]MBF4475446.1 UbiA family prenyltransferase [Methanobacterium formicicum]MDD4810144.1 UbiA family prenyltransferase [Methanobacterium formicicum]MDG3547611.1 UbiA family prenyltransferase [Methanobacterium formicicum]CEL25409.1 Digeranylgeranylglyceryl phosphate synthase [Methanobacterium formicicum]
MNPYLEILRPGNAVMAVIAIFLMAIISGKFTFEVLMAAVVVFLVTGAGNSINDYFDHKIDAINKPQRPIPSGRISLKGALVYSISLFAVGIIIAFAINLLLGIIALSSSLLMIYYARDLKTKCLIGNLSISFLTGLCFVFGGIAVEQIAVSIYLGFYAFLMTMAREIVKDMEDQEGDKEEGATTLPIVYGNRISSLLAALFMIIASVTSPILYFMGVFSVFYLPVLFLAIVIFLYSAMSILKDQSMENSGKISKRIKLGMAITFVAFAVGSPFLWSLLVK